MNMNDAIDQASQQITAAVNAATKASWEAGRDNGLGIARQAAQDIADKARTEAGKAAAGAVVKKIDDIIEDYKR